MAGHRSEGRRPPLLLSQLAGARLRVPGGREKRGREWRVACVGGARPCLPLGPLRPAERLAAVNAVLQLGPCTAVGCLLELLAATLALKERHAMAAGWGVWVW